MRQVLILILILILSGCVTPGLQLPFFGPPTTEYENDVIIIQQLQALPQEASPGQTIQVVAWIKNLGRTPVNNIEVELYDYCEGTWTFKKVGGGSPCGTTKEKKTCVKVNLQPYEAKRIVWELTASDVKFRTTCDFKVRVIYNYETTSYTTIKFINYQEMQRQLAEGTFKPGAGEIVLGEGPVKPILTTQEEQPIPVGEGGQQMMTLVLTLENRGSGFVEDNQIDIGEIKFSSQSGYPEVKGILNKLNDGCKKTWGKTVTFIGKSTPPLICQDTPTISTPQPEASISIQTTVSYTYEFRSSIPVTIQPPI